MAWHSGCGKTWEPVCNIRTTSILQYLMPGIDIIQSNQVNITLFLFNSVGKTTDFQSGCFFSMTWCFNCWRRPQNTKWKKRNWEECHLPSSLSCSLCLFANSSFKNFVVTVPVKKSLDKASKPIQHRPTEASMPSHMTRSVTQRG